VRAESVLVVLTAGILTASLVGRCDRLCMADVRSHVVASLSVDTRARETGCGWASWFGLRSLRPLAGPTRPGATSVSALRSLYSDLPAHPCRRNPAGRAEAASAATGRAVWF
jgi:hypothetical protein